MLATAEVPASSVPQEGGWVAVPFASPPAVETGGRYAIVLRSSLANMCDTSGGMMPMPQGYGWFISPDNPYAAGASFYSNDGAQTWNPNGTDGARFKTYVDNDVDGDGVIDSRDSCPNAADGDQADFDGDGAGDACDADDDSDGRTDAQETVDGTNPKDADSDDDGALDDADNCPTSAGQSASQTDTDGDGRGDVCDPAGETQAPATPPPPPPFRPTPVPALVHCALLLNGTVGRDALIGTPADETLLGHGGRDVLNGGDGDDCLAGGPGVDHLYGAPGEDRLKGGRSGDRLYGGPDDDRLYGERGDDRLYGEGGDDYLSGGSGDDGMKGGAGTNRYFGRSGDDRIYAANGVAERVNCGVGDDRAVVDADDRVVRCERVTRVPA